MDKEKINYYLTLIKIRHTVTNQIREYQWKYDNSYLSTKQMMKISRIIEHKQKRRKNLTKRLEEVANELKLDSRDKMCLNHYGMTLKDVNLNKGNDKRDMGRMLELLHISFMRECY